MEDVMELLRKDGYWPLLEEDDLEHHFWPIGRSAEIWGIDIPTKLVDEGEVNRFIQELEEVILGDYPIVDMVAVEQKLT